MTKEPRDTPVTHSQKKRDTGFSVRLRDVLAGRSAYSLAKAIGASASTVEQWLKGSSEPGLANLIAAANELTVSVQWLATGEGEMRPNQEGAAAPSPQLQAPAAQPIDAYLMGRLTDGIVKLYKEMGQGIALHQAVELAVQLHDEIVSAIDPDDDGGRAGAMAIILARLRKDLRAAAANPAETKRLA